MSQYTAYTDAELVALLSKGDRKAFEAIYKRYASALYRFAFSRLGDKEDTEELVQDIFVWIWSKHKTLGHVTILRSYLYHMLRYKMVNYFRHNSVKRQYVDHYLFFEAAPHNSTQEQCDLSDLLAVIDASLLELPTRCQTAFRLSRFEHLPIQHIAERMNISTRTVENYITDALKHLRVSCREFYQPEPE